MGAQDERPRFYEGQYLSAEDLAAIVEHQRVGDARHALGAHTWGIALGLDLVERPVPGAAGRVEVLLQPGFAWDGFGRPLAVTRPTPLPEALLAGVPHDEKLDAGEEPRGRLLPVWLAYDEVATRGPAAGYASCADGPQHSRVGETFRFMIGAPSASGAMVLVSIGARNPAPGDALKAFDPTAEALPDGSVPHQDFPHGSRPPDWPVPIGYVRWVARADGTGHFAARDRPAQDHAAGRIRAFRRHIGTVTERIAAVDGAIVLHQRGEDPMAPHRYARLISSAARAQEYRNDLVWVEGNLRVAGDAKVNGGKLQLLDEDGEALDTPLYLKRAVSGDWTELQIAVGTTDKRGGRLVIGPETKGSIDPRLAVGGGQDPSGLVGIGTAAPQAALHVVGKRVRLEDHGRSRLLELGVDGEQVEVASPKGDLHLRSGVKGGPHHIAMNPSPGDGNVGIGTDSPQQKLHVNGSFIRVDGAGGEQAYLGGDDIGGQDGDHPDVQLGSFNADVTDVALYNVASGMPMDLRCRDVYSKNVKLQSDARLKQDIAAIDDALAAVCRLRGVTFRWKSESESGGDAGRNFGLIAQEVAEVLPNLVHESPRGLSLSYLSLIPVLIEAVKTLREEVDRLREHMAGDAG